MIRNALASRLKIRALRAGSALSLGVALSLGAALLAGAAPARAMTACNCTASCPGDSKCSTKGASGCCCDCSGPGGTACCTHDASVVRPPGLLGSIAAADLVALAADLEGALGGDATVSAVTTEMMLAAAAFDSGDAGSFYASMQRLDALLSAFDQQQIDVVYGLARADFLF